MLVAALTLPFAGQLFPYGFPLFIPVVCAALSLSLVCKAWKHGASSLLVPVDGLVVLIAIALVFYLYGILLSDRLAPLLVGDVANAGGILMLYMAAVNAIEDGVHRDQLIDKFTKLLLIVALTAAVVGTFKFLLQLKGQRLGFVESAAGGRYPWGTALVRDYNMYALTLLCGAIVALMKLACARGIVWRIFSGVAFVVLCVVGSLAGSRRFWVVAPIAIFATLLLIAYKNGVRRGATTLVSILVIVAVGIFLIHTFVAIDFGQLYEATDSLRSRLFTLMAGGRTDPFGSRLERWEFAVALMEGTSIWTGQGFDYLHVFGCRFGHCAAVDYPHNPFLSALLYSGVIGAMSVGLFFLYTLYSASRIPSIGSLAMTCALILVCHLPFVLVSGNSIFSITTFLLSAMVCSLLCRRGGASEPYAGGRSASELHK